MPQGTQEGVTFPGRSCSSAATLGTLGRALTFRAPVYHHTQRAAQAAGTLRHRSLHHWAAEPVPQFPHLEQSRGGRGTL